MAGAELQVVVQEAEHRLLPRRRGGTVRALISVFDKSGLDVFARGLGSSAGASLRAAALPATSKASA